MEQELRTVVERLATLDAAAARLRRQRDDLVSSMHAAGTSWGDLAAITGTSRQALMKRHVAPLVETSTVNGVTRRIEYGADGLPVDTPGKQ